MDIVIEKLEKTVNPLYYQRDRSQLTSTIRGRGGSLKVDTPYKNISKIGQKGGVRGSKRANNRLTLFVNGP